MKVIVRIHTPSGLNIKKVKVTSDGKHLSMSRYTKKKDGWKPQIGTIEIKHLSLGRAAYYADIFPDSEKTWTVKYTNEEVDMPHWNKQNEEDLFQAKVIKAAGESGTPTKTPVILYIIAGISIIGLVVQFVLSGHVRIG